MSFRFARTAAIFGASFLALAAYAYIPPASFVLSETLKTHAGIKTIVMDGKITDLRNQTTLREVLRVDFASGNLSAAYFNENEAMGTYESHVKDIHRLGKFWLNLAMDPNHIRFKEAIEELNIVPSDKTEVKLLRIGNHVTWAWGSDPFIAFFKDQFLPNEYQTGGTGANNEGILLNEYTSATSDIRVPREVVIKLQGKEVYHYEVKSVKLNQTLKFTQAQPPLKSAFAKDWVTLVR